MMIMIKNHIMIHVGTRPPKWLGEGMSQYSLTSDKQGGVLLQKHALCKTCHATTDWNVNTQFQGNCYSIPVSDLAIHWPWGIFPLEDCMGCNPWACPTLIFCKWKILISTDSLGLSRGLTVIEISVESWLTVTGNEVLTSVQVDRVSVRIIQ